MTKPSQPNLNRQVAKNAKFAPRNIFPWRILGDLGDLAVGFDLPIKTNHKVREGFAKGFPLCAFFESFAPLRFKFLSNKKAQPMMTELLVCRGARTRTADLTVPNGARYQTAPHPVVCKNSSGCRGLLQG